MKKIIKIALPVLVVFMLICTAIGTSPAFADETPPATEAPAEVVVEETAHVVESPATEEAPAQLEPAPLAEEQPASGEPVVKESFVQMLIETVVSWVGPSDQSIEDLTDLEDSNGNGLHGDVDCTSDICEKVEGDDLPAPDSNNETVIPFTEIDGNVVVIHAGGGANEVVIDLNSGDDCDQSPEGDAFCASKDENGNVVIWSNPCANLVGKNDNCQPAPALSYVLAVTTVECEVDYNGAEDGCGEPPVVCDNTVIGWWNWLWGNCGEEEEEKEKPSTAAPAEACTMDGEYILAKEGKVITVREMDGDKVVNTYPIDIPLKGGSLNERIWAIECRIYFSWVLEGEVQSDLYWIGFSGGAIHRVTNTATINETDPVVYGSALSFTAQYDNDAVNVETTHLDGSNRLISQVNAFAPAYDLAGLLTWSNSPEDENKGDWHSYSPENTPLTKHGGKFLSRQGEATLVFSDPIRSAFYRPAGEYAVVINNNGDLLVYPVDADWIPSGDSIDLNQTDLQFAIWVDFGPK